MFNTIEAVRTYVLEIGAIDLHMEAGLCRRPHCVCKGTPTKREAWCWEHTEKLGSRAIPEAKVCAHGKPDMAGSPLQKCAYTWKLVYTGRLRA